jgi:hypothetical protein
MSFPFLPGGIIPANRDDKGYGHSRRDAVMRVTSQKRPLLFSNVRQLDLREARIDHSAADGVELPRQKEAVTRETGHQTRNAPKPNNAWWRSAETGNSNPPASIGTDLQGKGSTDGLLEFVPPNKAALASLA